jgi:hypothetical protein
VHQPVVLHRPQHRLQGEVVMEAEAEEIKISELNILVNWLVEKTGLHL